MIHELQSFRSETHERAQTEPLAALVAIIVMGIAVSMYAGYHTDTLATAGADRDVSEATLERVWTEIEDMGAYDESTPLESAIEHQMLPEGRHVYITITYVGDGGNTRIVDRVTFLPDGSTRPYPSEEITEKAERSSRPIAVRYGRKDVRGARLHVSVA